MERENLQTRWILMASRASKFDSKEVGPWGAGHDATAKILFGSWRAAKKFDADRTRRVCASRRDREKPLQLFAIYFVAIDALASEKEKRRGIIGGSLTSRSSIKRRELFSLEHRYSTGSLLAVIPEFREFASGVKGEISHLSNWSWLEMIHLFLLR